jgi:hypothetical protein
MEKISPYFLFDPLSGDVDYGGNRQYFSFLFIFSTGFTSSTNIANFIWSSRELSFSNSPAPEVKKKQDVEKNL